MAFFSVRLRSTSSPVSALHAFEREPSSFDVWFESSVKFQSKTVVPAAAVTTPSVVGDSGVDERKASTPTSCTETAPKKQKQRK
jgi:hypothetical protein